MSKKDINGQIPETEDASANSNFQNEFPFCVPVPLMKRQGVANIFPC
jgi:hypothetical protein